MREKISRSPVQRVLIAIGAFFLFWPAITTNLFGDGLSGYSPRSTAPEWSLSAWLDGRFQADADQWWKERFGLRFLFVKINNQINYSLWNRVYEGGQRLVFGKQDWLYEYSYVERYCGLLDPVPSEKLLELFLELRAFQDAMDARGVPFVVLITPSKAAMYPENMPDEYCAPHRGGGSEYDRARPLLRRLGIRTIDGYQLTQAARPLWPDVTLFTQGGAHWNHLGAYYTAAALVEQAGELANRDLPPLSLEDVVIDNDPTGSDRDLTNFLNLLFPDTDFTTAHPVVSMPDPEDGRLRVIFIGTSFFEQLIKLYAETGAFEQLDHYWYYHHSIRDGLRGGGRPITRKTVDWAGEILQADLLVLDLNMATMSGDHAERFLKDALAWLAENPE